MTFNENSAINSSDLELMMGEGFARMWVLYLIYYMST